MLFPHFAWRVSENCRFWIFCIDLVTGTRNPDAELQNLFVLVELPIVQLIRSDNIYNKVDLTFAIHYCAKLAKTKSEHGHL